MLGMNPPFNSRLPPAIPIKDLRSDEQRLRAAASPTGDMEGAAGRVISRFTGEQVIIQDNGTVPRTPDLRIEYRDRHYGVAEVVVDMNRDYGATYAGLLRWYGRIPAALPVPGSDRIWHVVLEAGANIKQLQKRLPAAINRFVQIAHEIPGELTWIEGIEAADRSKTEPLRELGVADIGSRPVVGDETGTVWIHAPRIYEPTDYAQSSLVGWINQFLSDDERDDVRRKLRESGPGERHVFALASFTSPWQAYNGLTEGGALPNQDPVLPDGITHLWVWTVPHVGRCLAWFPDRGWFEPRCYWATE
jgi:hypothetical protein